MKNIVAPMVNGSASERLSPADRGFNYGDGLFETIALIDRKLPLWAWHHERLLEGCSRLAIPVESSLVAAHVGGFVQQLPTEITHGVIKIVVSRGEGGRGYAPPSTVKPTICITYHELVPDIDKEEPSEVCLGLCQLRLSSQPLLAGIKHLNRLENIIARAELDNAPVDDGVLLDAQGWVIETTAANLFVVKNSQIKTPALSAAGVNGVARRFIIENFPQIFNASRCSLSVENVSLQDVKEADEVFCTNSIRGVRVVRTFAGNNWQSWPIASVIQQYLSGYVSDFLSSRKNRNDL